MLQGRKLQMLTWRKVAFFFFALVSVTVISNIAEAAGHGKRNEDAPYALKLLLQQALKARDHLPLYETPNKNPGYDIFDAFTDDIEDHK